jgi:hypothetical protein
MPNRGWMIRDVDYDVDKLGGGLIKAKTVLYHMTLLAKAKSLANGKEPSADNVEQAEIYINQEVHEKLRRQEIQQRGRVPSLKDFSIAVGSIFIGIFIGKIFETFVSQQNLSQLHWAYWVSLIIGILCFIPYLRSDI